MLVGLKQRQVVQAWGSGVIAATMAQCGLCEFTGARRRQSRCARAQEIAGNDPKGNEIVRIVDATQAVRRVCANCLKAGGPCVGCMCTNFSVGTGANTYVCTDAPIRVRILVRLCSSSPGLFNLVPFSRSFGTWAAWHPERCTCFVFWAGRDYDLPPLCTPCGLVVDLLAG